MKTKILLVLLAYSVIQFSGCQDDDMPGPSPLDPSTAPKVAVDRFSEDAGTLFVRDGSNGLPAANVPIDFDQGPFITQGLSPMGDIVRYYNFA